MLNRQQLQAILRKDFATFAKRSFYELNPGTHFYDNWHIAVIADALEQCLAGRVRRLIVNVPPRSLKSHLASIAFPAYVLGRRPTAQLICASYAQNLSEKLASDCRSLMLSNFYRELFPGTVLAANRQAISDYSTTRTGFRLATSVGGTLTGRGAEISIIDDPLKPDEALSEVQRNRVNDWFDHTLISRLNDKRDGCIILVMQRLHEDDLVGHVLRHDDWKVLSFPAIAERDETYFVNTLFGKRTFVRKRGDVLHSEREPLTELNRIRETQGEYNFAGQYQQAPAPLGGGMIKVAWFKSEQVDTRPESYDLVFQSWDSANKTSELNDFSVCTTWGVLKEHLYLLHVLRARMEFPELKRRVKERALAFNAKNILIEDKASGTQLLQDLRADGVHKVTPYQTKLDKVMRMHSVSSTIENGFVHIPSQSHWLAEYLHEMAVFPNGRFDDQVDSTSQALDWFRNGRQIFGLFDYYREQAGEISNARESIMKVPSVCDVCGNRHLSQYACNPVGDIEVTCNCGWSKIFQRPAKERSTPPVLLQTFERSF